MSPPRPRLPPSQLVSNAETKNDIFLCSSDQQSSSSLKTKEHLEKVAG